MIGLLKRGLVLAGAVAALLGCGNGRRATPDGGNDGSTPLTGRLSFDVVAALAMVDGGGSGLPPTNTFTLVLDADAHVAIAGGNGRGAVVPVTSTDGRTFRSQSMFAVGSIGGICSGPQDVDYKSFEVTIAADGSLAGTAQGSANISCGDCSFMVSFSATLRGTADKTPPVLLASGLAPVGAFDPVYLVASEPMPATATARLTGTGGVAIDLLPTIVDGDIPLVIGFSKPSQVLPAGQGYTVSLDGLVDFAGQTDRTGPPLGITSIPAAPLVAEDGFESATGSELGGALILSPGGPLPAITGNTSLYIGSPGAPLLGATEARSLLVRLARQPGDTKLRFSYRVIGGLTQLSFGGMLHAGSPGHSPGDTVYTASLAAATTTATLPLGTGTVYTSPVTTMEATLPDDATDEVLVSIGPFSTNCFAGPISTAGMLIDDMRLE